MLLEQYTFTTHILKSSFSRTTKANPLEQSPNSSKILYSLLIKVQTPAELDNFSCLLNHSSSIAQSLTSQQCVFDSFECKKHYLHLNVYALAFIACFTIKENVKNSYLEEN